MNIVSILNFKGGIAKTTSAIHLGAALAIKNKKTLVIDFDPQTSLSLGYKISKEKNQYTINDLLNGKSGFRVTEKAENLHILAGSKSIISKVRSINILKERLEQLDSILLNNDKKSYDFIIIDCPPLPMERMYYNKGDGNPVHIPNLNEIALTASTHTIIPLNAEKYSIAGLNQFLDDVINLKNDFNKDLDILGVFFSMVMKNEKNFKEYYSDLKEQIPPKYFFNTYIRKDINIEVSKNIGQSVFYKTPNSNAGIDYANLSIELLNKINRN